MIDQLTLWAAQDALLDALEEQESLTDVAKGLGQPANIEPEHVWISGGATGSATAELSGQTAPSDETFRLKVFLFAQADDYAAAREKVKALALSVEAALSSATFAAVVPAWSIPDYELDDGTDGTHVQLAMAMSVECQCW